jgi:hypothetical protein
MDAIEVETSDVRGFGLREIIDNVLNILRKEMISD